MAAPNIVNVTAIYGKTAVLTPSTTGAFLLLANAASSGKVLKINSIVATNVDGTNAYSATVSINTVATGGGTSYPVASTIPVPANAALVVTDKSTGFYLEEDRSIMVASSAGTKISFVCSYEEIS